MPPFHPPRHLQNAHHNLLEAEIKEEVRTQDSPWPQLKTEGEDRNMIAIRPQDFNPPPKQTQYWYDYEADVAMRHQYHGYYIVYY